MSTALHEDLVALTCDLVRFETTENRVDQLRAALEYAAAYLADVPDLVLERSEAHGKPALVVTLRETRTPALMLNGHLDVVVANPEQFVPEVRDGRIYGRGSQDMKGSCAVMLRLIRELAAWPERPDVGFQFVCDEEIGGTHGTGRLLAEGWRCAFMLCLEPTDMGILFEHKGAMWVELSLPGRPSHGSRPWDGHNPILDFNQGLQSLALQYPVPAPDTWRTTITPTTLQAGAGSRNQVPGSLKVTFDIRYVPEDTPAALLATLQSHFPTARVVVNESAPVLRTDPEHHAVSRLADLLQQRAGAPPRFYREHFSTDARYYTSAGIPAICLGPVGAGLHSDEEWVSVEGLVDLYDVLVSYIKHM